MRTALFFLALTLASPAGADCLQSGLSCFGDLNTYDNSTDPVRALDCSRFHVDAGASFDHFQGLVSAHSMSTPGNTASATITDLFVLTGPPPGTVVPIVVVGDFELQNVRQPDAATWSQGTILTPLIGGGPNPDPNQDFFSFIASAPGTETVSKRLQFAMNVKAGQGFEIDITAASQSSGNAGGYSHGRLSFEGLPPGSSVTSCKGFRQDQPTPVLARSWGALKGIYR